jgi:NitT/TauT family transport system substrate-binding protein
MKTNMTIRSILFIFTASMLAACSAFQPAEQSLPALRVEYSPWWGDYTIVIAKANGLFEKYGVEVEAVYYDVYSDSFADMAAGQLDGGLYGLGEAMKVSATTELKMVGIYDNGGFNTIIAKPDITSLADLRGKRIGVLLGTVYELFVVQALASAGIQRSDVQLVNVAPEDTISQFPNNLDAAYSWEPITSDAVAQGFKVLFTSDKIEEFAIPDGIFFRASVIQQRPEDIRAFIKAWYEAVDFRLTNPEKSRQIIADYIGVSVDEVFPDHQLKIMTFTDNQGYFEIKEAGKPSIIMNTASTIADFFLRTGILSNSPDLNSFLDASYLK